MKKKTTRTTRIQAADKDVWTTPITLPTRGWSRGIGRQVVLAVEGSGQVKRGQGSQRDPFRISLSLTLHG
jgi:hypothetical protein